MVNLRRQHKVTTSIDHAKSGLFINEHFGDMLCFLGSLNETYPAVVPELEDGNVEQFHVYRTSNRQRGETWQLFAEPVVERLLRAAGAEKVTKIGHGTIAVPFHEFEKSDFPSEPEVGIQKIIVSQQNIEARSIQNSPKKLRIKTLMVT